MTNCVALLLVLLLSGCDFWFYRRMDIATNQNATVAEAIASYAKEKNIPCSEPTALPIECWRQPIRIWGMATDHGIVVCYSAMGIPFESRKFTRRMNELESKLRQNFDNIVAASSEQCPPPPSWRS